MEYRYPTATRIIECKCGRWFTISGIKMHRKYKHEHLDYCEKHKTTYITKHCPLCVNEW